MSSTQDVALPGAGLPGTDAPEPRWSKTVGTVALVLAILLFVDDLGDLVIGPSVMESDAIRRIFTPDVVSLVQSTMPSQEWTATSALIGMALAVVLWLAGARLRRCMRSGVTLARLWAAMMIPWVAVQLAVGALWNRAHAAELTRLAGSGWEEWIWPGLVLGAAIGWAFPVFLLIWFARPTIASETRAWA